MKSSKQGLPSLVVIQERHVRHGENFKIFKVSCKSRREYIKKFMSSRKVTYRCKSRKVRIGCGMKETTYKGSPLAISRLLFLEGLEATFPTFQELKNQDDQMRANQASSTKYNPPLSFFNLSDQRHGAASSLKMPNPLNSLVRSLPPMDLDVIEKNCSPDKISDFALIFGSDTNEAEDFDSDDEDQEKNSVEIALEPPTTSPNTKTATNENAANNNIIVSLERMEKDIKNIVNAVGAARNKTPSNNSNKELAIGLQSHPQIPHNISEPKPHLSVPPIPLATRRNQPEPNSFRFLGDLQQPNLSELLREQKMARRNPQMNMRAPISAQQILQATNPGVGSGQRNADSSRGFGSVVEPSGNIPFFRVPGGCFMVIHATNQTTPSLHATFVTGCTNGLQFQQTQLPVYGAHQIVAIHLGPYRLGKEEINGVFAFANGTKVYAPCNPPRYK